MSASDQHNNRADSDNAQGRRAALVGVVANLSLATAKLLGGMVGHSHALVADAVESLADLVGSVIIWGGLRVGAVPPDDDHPYGHGKAEAIAGLAVAGIICVAGATVLYGAVSGLFEPRVPPEAWTLIVLLVVVVTKEALYRYVRRVARQSGSAVVEIDAWHHRVDAITSLTAGLGVGAAVIGGASWAYADNWAAMFGAAVILFNGVRLGAGPWHELMDREPQGVCEQVRAAASLVEGVRAIEKVHARKSGSRYFVDMHIEVDATMSVADAHVVSGKVKARVRGDVPGVANVLVHVEPHEDHPAKPEPS